MCVLQCSYNVHVHVCTCRCICMCMYMYIHIRLVIYSEHIYQVSKSWMCALVVQYGSEDERNNLSQLLHSFSIVESPVEGYWILLGWVRLQQFHLQHLHDSLYIYMLDVARQQTCIGLYYVLWQTCERLCIDQSIWILDGSVAHVYTCLETCTCTCMCTAMRTETVTSTYTLVTA